MTEAFTMENAHFCWKNETNKRIRTRTQSNAIVVSIKKHNRDENITELERVLRVHLSTFNCIPKLQKI